jgi:LmbE family N-acetylglucosaminyl deacetylase
MVMNPTNLLMIVAHPDDETYLAGGIMAAAAKNGQTVVCVTATKGEAGARPGRRWSPKKMGKVRSKELNRVIKKLGIKEHHCLNYGDGCCCDVDQPEACACLENYIEEYKPDSILTFGPEGLTGHQDHATVSGWVDVAVKKSGTKPNIYHVVVTPDHYKDYLVLVDEKIDMFFAIDEPPLVAPQDCAINFRLPSEIVVLKRESLATMSSQTKPLIMNFDETFIEAAFGLESFVLKRLD